MLRRDHTVVSPVANGLYRSIAVGWIRTQCRLLIAYVTLTLKQTYRRKLLSNTGWHGYALDQSVAGETTNIS